MKAIVLAGGYATRLWPITKHRPKMFLPVGDEVVVDHILSQLEAEDRIDDVYVSTNERFADAFRAHLETADYEKPTLSVEETTEEDEKFGVVGALGQLVEREGIEDDTLVIAGDNVISFAVSEFLDFFEDSEGSSIVAYDVDSQDRATELSTVELDGDRVVDFQEKPDDPQSTLVSIACYAFTAETLPLFEQYLDAGENPDEPGWFVQWLQGREPVSAFTFDGAWFDVGTPESYLNAVAWELDGDAMVSPDATLQDTEVGENVHVMEDTIMENCRLADTIVFPDATLRDADVRRSIIDRDTHLEGVDLSGALIGEHTHIDNGDG